MAHGNVGRCEESSLLTCAAAGCRLSPTSRKVDGTAR